MPDGAGFSMNDGPPTETPEEVVSRLAKLSEFEYARVRLEQAKLLGVSVKILDKEIAKVRSANELDAPKAGRELFLNEPEPWPDPVDTATVLDELAATLARHMFMSQDTITAAALWCAHTWVFERFDRTPRLAITSPTKRCGKSTLLEILEMVCRRSLRADSISASGVFRTVEAFSPVCLLVDEADSFLPDNEELRGILNSGFARGGRIVRIVDTKDGPTPMYFATFAPVALAAIKSVPDTIADRSVPIRLARKAKQERVTLMRAQGSRPALVEIARKLARWSADNRERLGTDPPIPDAMGDREGDISVVLLAIADHAGGVWAGKARNALLAVFGTRAKDDGDTEVGVQLLTDIRSVFLGRSALKMGSKDLCERLAEIEESPWAEWNHEKPITPPRLARLLRPFKVRPATIRSGEGTEKGYHRVAFEDAWKRYLTGDEASTGVSQSGDTSGDE
jgi:Protein of unknown function (DUF3631)